MLSLQERATIEQEVAQGAFHAFQAAKNDVPLRPAEIERLQQLAIAAAQSHLDRRRALEKEATPQGPSDLPARHDDVMAAERLLRQARETERGLAETASDDLAVAIHEARAAKEPLQKLQWEVAQGRPHTTDEMNQAQDAMTGAEVKLMIASENEVQAWQRAWAAAVVDSRDGEGDEVRTCAQGRDRAEAAKRKLDEEGLR